MKDQILQFIKERNHVSFQELSGAIDGFSGDFPLPLPDHENIIVWHSLSKEAGKALIDLLIANKIFAHPFDSRFAAFEGGEFPRLPNNYRSPLYQADQVPALVPYDAFLQPT